MSLIVFSDKPLSLLLFPFFDRSSKNSCIILWFISLIDYIELSFNYPKTHKEEKIYIFTKSEQNKITNYSINNLNNKNLGILISLYSGLSSLIYLKNNY